MCIRVHMLEFLTDVTAIFGLSYQLWGLIYKCCVHIKWDLKDAYATSHCIMIYKNKLGRRLCALVR